MQAVLLAGGKGTRLRPYTVSLPKPLVPVDDYPIAEIVVRQLRRFGFREIIISTGHLAELVEAYFGSGKKWGVKIRYVREDKPLNTAGALKLIRGLDEHFLVMNGDLLTTLDFGRMLSEHKKKGRFATIGVCRREVRIDFGVIELLSGNRFADYIEKPTYAHHVSMGVNVFNRRVQKYIEHGESIGIPDLIRRAKEAGEEIHCHVHSGEWLDIGRVDDYQHAQDVFEANSKRYLR
jgi:NDP-sugar pyrophosphorylase family protein